MSILFSATSYALDPKADPSSPPESVNIEEGWVEKKIAPSTQWVESIFAPFTQWMESEIQTLPEDTSAPSTSDTSLNNDLISINQAISTVLKHHPGKILHSQFKTGPPPHYQIKVLSNQGNVSFFYIHAFSGKPFLPESITLDSQEVKP